jgi:hypothetical protein
MQNNDPQFSVFFGGIKTPNAKPKENALLKRLVEIYNCEYVVNLSREILAEKDPVKQQLLKNELPYFTPYGTFEIRQNALIEHHNANIIAIDIDKLSAENVQYVKTVLSLSMGTMLCAVSPRGKGVKALISISDTIPLQHHYETLKLNVEHITSSLGLNGFVIDVSQFVLSQPLYIAHDPEMFVNFDYTPLPIKLIEYRKPVFLDTPADVFRLSDKEKTKYLAPIDYRIKRYFESAVNGLLKSFAFCVGDARHPKIIRVQSIAVWMHYAPQMVDEVENRLLQGVIDMYGGIEPAKASNALKSFKKAWNDGLCRPQQNNTIEAILNDPKYSTGFMSIKELKEQRP